MDNENFNAENFDYLKGQLEQLGWGNLAPQLEEHIRAGKEKIELNQNEQGEVEGRTVDYELQFNKHSEHPFYYFNRVNATLRENDEIIATASFRSSWKLMPEEMGRILEYGDKVAVYREGIKNDAGEPFNAWISVNANQPLDEHGHLNMNTYHDRYYKKYPFDLDYSISRLPEQIKVQIKDKHEEVKDCIRQGIPYGLDVATTDGIVQGCLSANAKVGRIDILDNNLELAKLPVPQKAERQNTGQETSTEQGAADEKKKPWQYQQVRGNQFRNKQGKGISR
ncbi:MAG: hypothetical protein BGO31_05505 [Bacteroidetes bacterium 43-16]|uniref:hypothetical protein n=1 Tax=uncultured Dysgonomonas sp. TaxID=206096 RepID=UPI000926F7AD|nr:hypothetical protein [uncultured Dysgonomonas sp.]OJV52287.1 MAG: hypothetical protein BGO31_05505 [Bacteroidetes bacterium 43-16]